jgi:NhaA family Na+:H+ antiporter
LLGPRIPPALRVFVAALAVVDDVLSVLILAIFFPRSFEVTWLIGSAAALLALLALNRSRVYATWPYALTTVALWFTLHHAGVHGALAGVLLAGFLPTQPTPAAGPLLAQAANALAALEHAEREAKERVNEEPVWDWASRNLSAASRRLLSPADRIERALAPWSAYVVLPLFAFSATGVVLDMDLSAGGAMRVLAGVVLGLVVGKPLGITLASGVAVKSRLAVGPEGVSLWQFVGAACLCGVADTVALLLADHAALPGPTTGVAKIGCVIGSFAAAALGTAVLVVQGKAAPTTPA